MISDNDQCCIQKSVTLLAVGLLVFTLFQLTQVLQDSSTLSKGHAQIVKNREEVDKALAEGAKMQDQLNAVAIGTQKLADGGNANAKEIVAQMNKLGIKIDPNFRKGQAPANGAAPPPPPPPAPAKP